MNGVSAKHLLISASLREVLKLLQAGACSCRHVRVILENRRESQSGVRRARCVRQRRRMKKFRKRGGGEHFGPTHLYRDEIITTSVPHSTEWFRSDATVSECQPGRKSSERGFHQLKKTLIKRALPSRQTKIQSLTCPNLSDEPEPSDRPTIPQPLDGILLLLSRGGGGDVCN